MNNFRNRPITKIALTRIVIAFLSISAVIITVILEIPERDFPKTLALISSYYINYWSDIFFPAIDVPVRVFVILMVLNTFILFFAYWLSKRRQFFWTIGVVIISFIDVLFIWVSLLFVHNGLICQVEAFRNEDLWGCDISGLEPLHIIIGTIFSILIVVLGTVFGKKSLLRIK